MDTSYRETVISISNYRSIIYQTYTMKVAKKWGIFPDFLSDALEFRDKA